MMPRVAWKDVAPASLAGAAFLLAASPAWAQTGGHYNEYGPHMMWGWGWGGFIFGPLVMIVVLVAVIVAAVLVVRWIGHPGAGWQAGRPPEPEGDSAMRILRERFAHGEIDQEEFETRRRQLER